MSFSVPQSVLPPPQGWTAGLGRLGRLTAKELREILRDRRTVITLVLMPLLLYPLLSIAFQQFFLSSAAALGPPEYRFGFPSIRDARVILDYLGLETLEGEPGVPQQVAPPLEGEPLPRYQHFVPDDLEAAVRLSQIDLGFRVKEERRTTAGDLAVDLELIYRKNSLHGRQALEHARDLVTAANEAYLGQHLRRLGVTQRPAPVRALPVPLEDPQRPGQFRYAAVIPLILILMTITGAVYPAIDLTAGERERGTLEILIAAPVPRLGLLLAKYFAVVTVAILTATVNLVSMVLTLIASGLGTVLFGAGGVSVAIVLQVFALLLLFAAFFSAVLLSLTSFARSFKEAQAYLIPLMLVSLAPGMLSLMPGLELTGLLPVAPLLNIVVLARDLLELRAEPASAAVVVISTLLYALAAIAVAARVFGAEGVLYSSQMSWSDLWRRPPEPRPQPTAANAMFLLALLFPAHFLLLNLIARSGLAMGGRLMLAALVAVGLFAGLPLLFAARGHLDARSTFACRRAPFPAYLGAALLGMSLWPIAHEIVVTQSEWGLATLRPELLQRVQEWLEQLRELPAAGVILAMAVVPAVCEELFFRGYLLSALRDHAGARTAMVTSGILFGVFHLVVTDALAPERLLPSTLLGIVLAWVCWRSGSVFPGMVLHACHNGLLVSAAYYQPQLAAGGWGIEEQSHLPRWWVVAALFSTAVASAVVHVRAQSASRANEPAAWRRLERIKDR